MMSRDIFTDGANGNDANLLDDGTSAHGKTGASCKSDTLKLYRLAQGFIIHAAGSIKVMTAKGTVLKLPALAVGIPIPIAIRQVFATDTSLADTNITLGYGEF